MPMLPMTVTPTPANLPAIMARAPDAVTIVTGGRVFWARIYAPGWWRRGRA